MLKTRLCRPSLLSSKPCRDYSAAASICNLLQRDISLPPDIRDNLERCAAALEEAAVAAGATLPSTTKQQQPPLDSPTAHSHSRKQAAIQSQPASAVPANVSGAVDGATPAAAEPAAPSGSDAGARAKGAQQSSSPKKKKKRKSEQSAAMAADAAVDTPRLPNTEQPAEVPATDTNEDQPGKKKHKQRHSGDGVYAAGSSAAPHSNGQATAARGVPEDAAVADGEIPTQSKKKRKKDKSIVAEQQDGQAAHGAPRPDAGQASSGSTGKKPKKRKQKELTTDS